MNMFLGAQSGFVANPMRKASRTAAKKKASLGVRPLPARLFQVAAGLAEFTIEEREWIAHDPQLANYMQRIRKTIPRTERINGKGVYRQAM